MENELKPVEQNKENVQWRKITGQKKNIVGYRKTDNCNIEVYAYSSGNRWIFRLKNFTTSDLGFRTGGMAWVWDKEFIPFSNRDDALKYLLEYIKEQSR